MVERSSRGATMVGDTSTAQGIYLFGDGVTLQYRPLDALNYQLGEDLSSVYDGGVLGVIDVAPVNSSANYGAGLILPPTLIPANLFDDVILIEYCDLHGGEDGSEYILRGGIAVPINQVHNAWRKGKVILNGPRVQYAKVGDVVVFPNNMGIPITNLEVEGYGKIKNGLFINEQRMFGICKVNDKTENK